MRPLTDTEERDAYIADCHYDEARDRELHDCTEMPTLVPDAPGSRPPSDWTGFTDEMRRILDDAGEL